jgi:hypothetical protein
VVDKIMFYTNDTEDLKEVLPKVPMLEEEGYEVAFATDNVHLIRALSIAKFLVVNPKTYHYSTVVTDNKTFKEALSFKDFLEVAS